VNWPFGEDALGLGLRGGDREREGTVHLAQVKPGQRAARGEHLHAQGPHMTSTLAPYFTLLAT